MTKKKLPVKQQENEDGKKWAKNRAKPSKNAVLAINEIYKGEHPFDPQTMLDELKRTRDQINSGDNAPLEEMLIAQAQTLDALFYFGAERISNSRTKEQLQSFLDITAKANNAFRKTISTLQHLKNPASAVFIREQNNALAQQVNNHLTISKIPKCSNELLEVKENEWLESGKAIASGSVNTKMEALANSRCENK